MPGIFYLILFYVIIYIIKYVISIRKKSKLASLSKTADMLSEDKFWSIVNKTIISTNQSSQEKILINEIKKLSLKEIIGFRLRTDKLLYDSYTSDLWCAAYIMNGGSSDDSFQYFRCWIISRGETVFKNAVLNPDSLISEVDYDIEFYDFENFWYVAINAFREKTGEDLYKYIDDENFKFQESNYPQIEFTWNESDEESKRKICPKLYKKLINKLPNELH